MGSPRTFTLTTSVPIGLLRSCSEIGEWELNKPKPEKILHPSAAYALASYLSTVYLFGGLDSSGDANGQVTNQLFEYDSHYHGFKLLTPRKDSEFPPSPRVGSTLTYVESSKSTKAKLYLFGGLNARNEPLDELHIFDPFERVWTIPKVHGIWPEALESHTCVYYRRMLIFFGGRDKRNEFSNTVFYLKLDSMSWFYPNIIVAKDEHFQPLNNNNSSIKTSNSIIPGLSQHTATVYGDFMIVQGGLGSTNSDPLSFNLQTFTWEKVQLIKSDYSPPHSSNHACSIVRNDRIL